MLDFVGSLLSLLPRNMDLPDSRAYDGHRQRKSTPIFIKVSVMIRLRQIIDMDVV